MYPVTTKVVTLPGPSMDKKVKEIYKAIDVKLNLLKFTHSQANSATENENLTAMERLRNTLATKVEEVHNLKVEAQELRFEAGNSEDEILTWNAKLEERVGVFEMAVNDLGARIKEIKNASQKQEEDQTAKIRERKFDEEMRFEKAKLEQRLKYEMEIKETRKDINNKEKSLNGKQSINAKLPKLVITKFNGMHTDWLCFWNQFKAEIDSVHISSITKFSYLKELLGPKVRATTEGLPSTIEGYERAKNILKTKYGKESEIINAHVTNIMSLPVIHGANPSKILKFYEAL